MHYSWSSKSRNTKRERGNGG